MSDNSSGKEAAMPREGPDVSRRGFLFRGGTAWWKRLLPFLAGCIVTLSCVTFPLATSESTGLAHGPDESFSLLLDYMHQNGVQYGTEHAYTYGPLGFLVFFVHSPGFGALRMAVDILLAILVSISLCLLAWRLALFWRCLLLAVFCWMAANTFPRAELLINTGLLCFGLLCFTEDGWRVWVSLIALALLAAFSALAKISFLFVAPLTIGFVSAGLLARRNKPAAAALSAGFVAFFLIGWISAGQHLANLMPFFTNAFAMVRAYNAALGLEVPPKLLWTGATAAALLFISLAGASYAAFSRTEILRRILLFFWLLMLSLAVWKHGFVRAHPIYIRLFLGYAAVAAAALAILPLTGPALERWIRRIAVTTCLVAVFSAQWLVFDDLVFSRSAPFKNVAANAAAILNPAAHLRARNGVVEEHSLQMQSPAIREIVGTNTVDVFGHCQSVAIFNHLNYQPRPVPQSYAVCSPALMKLNEDFFLSRRAPAFVLFSLDEMDRKFPVLADALTLRHLAINYSFVSEQGRFLLLKRRSSEPASLSLLREQIVRPGEKIDLASFGSDILWMDIQMTPSLAGRVRQFFLRPPLVRLTAYENSGKTVLFRKRSPPSMMAAGFLASPLLVHTKDLLSLYSGQGKHPDAYSINLVPGEEHYWKEDIRVRIFRIENPIPQPTPLSDAPGSPETPEISHHKPERQFTLIRNIRWRQGQPAPGNLQEQLAMLLFASLPLGFLLALILFARRLKSSPAPASWRALLIGNLLVFLILAFTALLGAEIYYRFVYDTTDSLGFTRVCERWVQRHWQVNAVGCRDNVQYHARIRPGARRVTFIGDSFTAGHGIPDVENRFPNLLRKTHPDLEIHALAYVGLDTARQTTLLRQALNQGYQLDRVILVYCLNDIGDLMPPEVLEAAQRFGQDANRYWLLRNSYFLNFAWHRLKASRDPMLRNYFPQVRSAYSGPLWEIQKERLRAFHNLVRENGGQLSVVTFPFLHALGPQYEYTSVHAQLNQFWQSLDVPHLDLLPVYSGLPPSAVTVNPFDAHPNEHASRLAAEAMAPLMPGPGK